MKIFKEKNLRKNQKEHKICIEYGNVLLELALILPLLLLLVAGIVQFGFILNAKIAVNSASYEAARVATLSDDPAGSAMAAVENYASSTLPGWNFKERLKAKVNASGTNPGDLVSVEVIYMIPLFFAKISPFSENGNRLTEISGSSVMRIEEKE